jgi:hypothetical protein
MGETFTFAYKVKKSKEKWKDNKDLDYRGVAMLIVELPKLIFTPHPPTHKFSIFFFINLKAKALYAIFEESGEHPVSNSKIDSEAETVWRVEKRHPFNSKSVIYLSI